MQEQDSGETIEDVRRWRIKIKNPATDSITTYIVYELDGAGRDFYWRERDARTRKDPATGRPVVDANGFLDVDVNGFAAAVLGQATYRINAQGMAERATMDELQAIPGRVLNIMFNKLQVMSALTVEAEDAEKKGLPGSATTGTTSPPSLDAPSPNANGG